MWRRRSHDRRAAVTGFSADWLALREPADQAARSPHVLDACAGHFASHASLLAADLGAGTGATVRALATVLPAGQDWCLVDADAANLAIARRRHPVIRTMRSDLAQNPAAWPRGTGLVTASALLDLVSPAWIEALVAALAAERLPLLAMLTVDGSMEASPGHPLDQEVAAAFALHMHRDKGFGPAAGGDAPALLERALDKAGYCSVWGDSPWFLDAASPELLAATRDGIAAAVAETGRVAPADLAAWLAATPDRLTIGHRDVFAWSV